MCTIPKHRIAPVVAKNSRFPPPDNQNWWPVQLPDFIFGTASALPFAAFESLHRLGPPTNDSFIIGRYHKMPPSTHSIIVLSQSISFETNFHTFPHFRHFHLYLEIWLFDLFDQSPCNLRHSSPMHTRTPPRRTIKSESEWSPLEWITCRISSISRDSFENVGVFPSKKMRKFTKVGAVFAINLQSNFWTLKQY